MKVAFLGLGAIGAPMAAHFSKSHELVVWNRTPERLREFAALHACTAASTPKEAVKGADAVLTCLPASAQVEEILQGDNGMMAGFSPGGILIDCTSGDPDTSRRIAQRLAEVDVAFADSPVSGGVRAAEAGTLTVMVGADARTYERAVPVLQCFASKIEHMGPVGAGHAIKSVNNALFASSVITFAEGMVGLVKDGINAHQAVDVLNNSSGRSRFSEVLVPAQVLSGKFAPSFRLTLMEKDVSIALDFLKQQGVVPLVLQRTGEALRELHNALGDNADFLEIVKYFERQVGVEIRG
ncbi:NAD(P)-dependent oxidoreductase [Paraburkholderia sp. 22B1P]|uniref:NAD(P)-dependent oxidoreductase n=1 Tax=Paraburkholderia sp. 22B1P TaxID=3080498 RepID=UPI003091C0E8|nr:NAD(P)-dependent oxidoreductase [Paraburkholderia sp. 22B1P]